MTLDNKTSDDSSSMTAIEIIDKVTEHLLNQNKKSISTYSMVQDENGQPVPGCLYRGEDGLKCAIGCLIKDDEYSFDIEGYTVLELYESKRLFKRLAPYVELLLDLQSIHDDYEPSEWPRLLKKLREAYVKIYSHE